MYSVRDLCDRYGVRETTVLAWIHAGELKAVNVGVQPGKKRPRWRISEDALTAFEEARAATPAPKQTRRKRRKADPDVVEFYK